MLTLLNPSSVWLMLFGWMVLHNPFAISILVLVAFFSGWWPSPIKYCYSLTMDGSADSLQLFVLNQINIPLPFDVIDNVWLVCIRRFCKLSYGYCTCDCGCVFVRSGVFLCVVGCACVCCDFFVLIVVLLYCLTRLFLVFLYWLSSRLWVILFIAMVMYIFHN